MREEYIICHEKAVSIEDNIWKTATIISIGTIAGDDIYSSPHNFREKRLLMPVVSKSMGRTNG